VLKRRHHGPFWCTAAGDIWRKQRKSVKRSEPRCKAEMVRKGAWTTKYS